MAKTLEEALAEIAAKGGTAGATTGEPTVYLGQTSQYVGSILMPASDKRVSLTEGIAEFNNWSDEERRQWGKRLYGAGLIDNANDWDAMTQAWKWAVTQTAGLNAGNDSTKKNLTPWGFISLLEDQGAFDDNLAARKKATQPRTSTSTSVNAIPSKSDAEVAIKTLFREQLGRDPEDGEIDRYTSMMLSKMRADPGSSTTVTTSNPVTGNSTSRTTQKAGFNPAGALEDKVQADPEWGAYQAATTYFNALQGAIGAPG